MSAAESIATMKGPAGKGINLSETERWISMFSGAALVLFGISRESWAGKAALSAAGAYFLYRGQTGYDPLYKVLGVSTTGAARGVTIDKAITINRSPEDVYRFWHNFENLPRFMEHLESVKVYDDRHSHWIASVPGGISFAWDAEMIEDIPTERISWRSLPNSEVQNEGAVEFRGVPGGTRLVFRASYAIPGVESKATSKMFQYLTEKQLEKELNHFKNLIETPELRRAA